MRTLLLVAGIIGSLALWSFISPTQSQPSEAALELDSVERRVVQIEAQLNTLQEAVDVLREVRGAKR